MVSFGPVVQNGMEWRVVWVRMVVGKTGQTEQCVLRLIFDPHPPVVIPPRLNPQISDFLLANTLVL